MKRPFLERLLEIIIVPGVLILIAIGFVSVCLRYFSGGDYALFWSEEVLRYGFIWIFWLASPLLIAKRMMFTADFFSRLLPGRLQTAMTLLLNAAITLLLAIYTYQGILMTRVNWMQMSTALELPIGWAYLAIPVGSAAMLTVVVYQSLRVLGVFGQQREERSEQ